MRAARVGAWKRRVEETTERAWARFTSAAEVAAAIADLIEAPTAAMGGVERCMGRHVIGFGWRRPRWIGRRQAVAGAPPAAKWADRLEMESGYRIVNRFGSIEGEPDRE